ncbi:MAG: phosphoglycerate kinase [Nitrososphaerales archaeon]
MGSSSRILTIEDLEPENKTVFVRADLNTPVDPFSRKLLDFSRISEACVTLKDLSNSKVVLASHQGRVGRYDFISLEEHSKALSKLLGKDVIFIEDVIGPAARNAISSLSKGQILLLDNLRFVAEENYEFKPEDAVKTILIQRLYKFFDMVVVDAFPTAHRAHPSIVGFPELLPASGGRLVVKELKALNKILSISKGPYVTVLGGAKISDRLEAIDTLIESKRADKVLLTGLIANVFLKASGKIKQSLGIENEEKYVERAKILLNKYPDTFLMPKDVAISIDDERKEIEVSELEGEQKICDIGSKTIEIYSKIIRSAGTIFMSGPPGLFEHKNFQIGTEALLKAMASSFGTTIVSGGHLVAALERFGIREWIDHTSTAGGALIMYLVGKKLPLFEALENSAKRFSKSERLI